MLKIPTHKGDDVYSTNIHHQANRDSYYILSACLTLEIGNAIAIGT